MSDILTEPAVTVAPLPVESTARCSKITRRGRCERRAVSIVQPEGESPFAVCGVHDPVLIYRRRVVARKTARARIAARAASRERSAKVRDRLRDLERAARVVWARWGDSPRYSSTELAGAVGQLGAILRKIDRIRGEA